MATITPTHDPIANSSGKSRWVFWEAMGDADEGESIEYGHFADRSVQVIGTFGGATVTIQGSNDNTNWETLNDLQGNAIALTEAGLKGIAEAVRYIRAITAGGSGTDVDVHLFSKSV